jgi:hypothetical protein
METAVPTRRHVWKIVGGRSPYPYLKGGPDSGFNYWIYQDGQYFAGPFDTPELCRRAAAQRLLEIRAWRNLMRGLRRIVKR